jgi:hypothetical protein
MFVVIFFCLIAILVAQKVTPCMTSQQELRMFNAHE